MEETHDTMYTSGTLFDMNISDCFARCCSQGARLLLREERGLGSWSGCPTLGHTGERLYVRGKIVSDFSSV